MSVQFPKLESVTLPSMEMWGTNMNILKDPPKSLFTRKIDKVNAGGEITQEIDDSGDRICQYINVYARGTNPMVGVSYQNSGGNALGSANPTAFSAKPMAFAPYRVLDHGAFRPPLLTARDLLPLSRQPRAWTSALANPQIADYSKKAMVCPDAKTIKNEILKVSVRPTGVFHLEKPITQTYDIKNNVVDRVKTSASSGVGTRDLTMKTNQKVQRVVDHDVVHVIGNTNKTFRRHSSMADQSLDTDKFIQRNLHNNNVSTAKKGYEKTMIMDDIELERVLPLYSATTNCGDSRIFKAVEYENQIELSKNTPVTNYTINLASAIGPSSEDFQNRDIVLAPKPKVGGFEGKACVPSFTGDVENPQLKEQRHLLGKKAYSLYEGRYQ
jgi:hypothetical protein